jgi:DNA-binding MarR family transcriptional regulator
MTSSGERLSPCGEVLNQLIWEIPFAFFRMQSAADRISHGRYRSSGKWSLMLSLDLDGTQSVSQIAHARPVARQGVQRMADELAEEGLVEFIENPTHKRAKLVWLTAKGEKFVRQLNESAVPWTNAIARRFREPDVAAAVQVLRKFRELLTGNQINRTGGDGPRHLPARLARNAAQRSER